MVRQVIALDTNVVVRLLVTDDEAQTATAVRLVRRARDEGARLLVSDIVVCEIAWVLRSCYGKSRTEVAAALDVLLTAAQVEFPDREGLVAALTAFRGGRGDLSDYLIRAHSHDAGAEYVATFDRALHGEPGFVTAEPGEWGPETSIREDAPAYGRGRRGGRLRAGAGRSRSG